jgi:hypothetical protein
VHRICEWQMFSESSRQHNFLELFSRTPASCFVQLHGVKACVVRSRVSCVRGLARFRHCDSGSWSWEPRKPNFDSSLTRTL